MSDDIDLAQDGIEKAAHETKIGRVPHARSAAIVIAVLAAMLAIAENGARDAQTGSLAGQIEASDTWAQGPGEKPADPVAAHCRPPGGQPQRLRSKGRCTG